MRQNRASASFASGTYPRRVPTREETGFVLATLGEPNRLLLLQVLLEEERCVQQLVDGTGLVQSLVSKHLRRLADAGLIQCRPSGRRNYYSVTDPGRVQNVLTTAAGLAERRVLEPAAAC
jgi:DNA-binding transcriptional ArsR family regulator